MLAGISYLVKVYGIAATDPGKPGYQSVLSMLTSAVFGKGIFYYLTIGSILVVLSLSANTAFADFPRLCRAIAQNNYLPHAFGYRGRRLVYTYGIVVLAVLCGGVLIAFGGVTDRLIPLYAVGAFLAFTLSQSGMVVHWTKKRGPHWVKSALVNGLGAIVTGITTLVVLVAKFVEGAWITLLFIPANDSPVCHLVRRHYHFVTMQTACNEAVDADTLAQPPIVVIAFDRWSKITCQGIRICGAPFSGGHCGTRGAQRAFSQVLEDEWELYVAKAFRAAGKEPPTAAHAAFAVSLCHNSVRAI